MMKLFKYAAMVAFATGCLAAQAQDGGKMLKKEGKTDDKMLRENRRMMKDGRVKRDESMTSEPKLIKKEDRLYHKKASKKST
jgi:Ni/Co efflux regulator RcnB